MCMKALKKITNNNLLCFILLALTLSLLITFMSNGILGNDFWWHIKVGENICNTGNVPQTDIFSWYGTEHNIEWTAHEWLGDVVLYGIHALGGEVAIFAFCIFMAALFNVLIWREMRGYIQTKMGTVFYLLLTLSVTCTMFFYGRPQIFGFFFVYEELKILYAFITNPRSKTVFLVPLITVLWSNIYGGSSNLSYILCGIFLVGSLFEFKTGKIEAEKIDKKAQMILLIVTVLTVGAVVLNPIGINVLTYPYENLSDSVSMSFISEWKAPDAKLWGNLLLFFVPVALTIIGFIHTEKKIKFLDLLVNLIFLFLFLRSVRFIMLWFIAAVFTTPAYLPEGPKINVEGKKTRAVLSAVLIICVFFLCGTLGGVYKTCKTDNQISVAMSDEAVVAVKECNPKRIFNDYDLGETLIYNDIPVFFDARADLYSKCGILTDGLELMSMQPLNVAKNTNGINVEQMIEKYDFDYILIKKARPLFVYLNANPSSYPLVYEDDSVSLFAVRRE